MQPAESPTISSVEFRRFKALGTFSLKLQRMNILVGPNNSGKSTAIGAFRALAAGIRRARAKSPEWVPGPKGQMYGYAIPEDTLPISVENVHTDYEDEDSSVRFRVTNGNHLLLYFPREGGCFLIPESTQRVRSPTNFKVAFPITIGVVPVLGPLEHEEDIVEPQTVQRNLSTHRASRNFRNYWHHFPEGFNDFAEKVRQTWPGMAVTAPARVSSMAKNLSMFYLENRASREMYWAGFGFQIWCQLLTHIVRAAGDSLLIVDEPETYLHPDLQRQFLALVRDAGPDVVLATHSTEIVAEADPTEICVVDKTRRAGVRLKHVEDVQSTLEALGSGQNITLSRIAKHRRVLFVEGPDDFKYIRLLAKQAGFSELSTATELTAVHGDGFSSWEKIESTAWGIQRALGQDLQIGAIFDRDFWAQEEIESIEASLAGRIAMVHVHKRKEVENYLLDVPSLEAAMSKAIKEKRRRDDNVPEAPNLEALLHEITAPMKSKCGAQYVEKRKAFLQKGKRKSVDASTLTEETLEWFEGQWSNISSRLHIVRGKEVLKALRTSLQNSHGITLTDHRIVSEMRGASLPPDLIDLLSKLDDFRRSEVSGTAAGV